MNKDYEKIADYCIDINEIDATKLVNKLMDMDFVPMHGPIHHFIVPAVLLTCYNNIIGDNKDNLIQQLNEAMKRASIVPGANCASCGACGAVLGFGQFASIITDNTPLSQDSWSKVMEIVSTIGLEVSKHGGPRCCKRDVYLSILTGAEHLDKLLGIKIKTTTPICKYFPKNNQCRKEKCLYYPKSFANL